MRFTSLTFYRQCDNTGVLASVFVVGTAEELAFNRRHKDRLVFNFLHLIFNNFEPNVSLHCGVGLAAAGQSEVIATVHLHGGSHRHRCLLWAVCGRRETKSEVKEIIEKNNNGMSCSAYSHSTFMYSSPEVVPLCLLREQL